MSSYSDNPLLGYESIANITQNSINHNELIVDTDISIILLKVHAYSSGGAAGYVNLKIKPNGCISKLRIYSPSDTGGDGGYHGNNGGSDGGGGGDAVSVTCVLKDDERTDGYENNIIAVIGGGGGNGGAHGNSGKKGGNTSLGGDIFGDFYLIKGETGTDSWGYGGLGGNQTANSPYVAKSTWSRDFAGGQVSSGGEGGRGGPFVYDGQTISGGTNYIYTSAGEYGRDHQGTGFGGAGGGGGAYAWRDYGDTKASEDSELLPPYYLSINCGGGGGGSIGGNDCGGGGGGAGFAGGNGGGGGKGSGPNFPAAGGGGGSTGVRQNNSITLNGVGVGIEIDSSALSAESGTYWCSMFKNTGFTANGEDLVHKFKLRDNDYFDNNVSLQIPFFIGDTLNSGAINKAFEHGGSSSDPASGFTYQPYSSWAPGELSHYLKPA